MKSCHKKKSSATRRVQTKKKGIKYANGNFTFVSFIIIFCVQLFKNQIKFAEYTFTCKFDLLDEIKRFYLNAIRPNNMK